MKKTLTRILSGILCLCMLVGMLPAVPFAVYAEGDEDIVDYVDETENNEEKESDQDELDDGLDDQENIPLQDVTSGDEEDGENNVEISLEVESEEENDTSESNPQKNLPETAPDTTYPWDGMTDEEFAEWVMAEENREYIYFAVSGENDEQYEALLGRVNEIEIESLLDGVVSALISVKGGSEISALAESQYMWPVPTQYAQIGVITSGRNYNPPDHYGIDIPVKVGTPVLAAKSGKIIISYTGCSNVNGFSAPYTSCEQNGCQPHGNHLDSKIEYTPITYGGKTLNTCNLGFGNGFIISHEDGTYSCYAHMSKVVNLNYGDRVEQGQFLGYSGSSGASTGPHLHFQLTKSWSYPNTNTLTTNPSVVKYIPNETIIDKNLPIKYPADENTGGGTGGSGSTSGEYTGGPNATWEEYKPYCKSITPINGTITQKSTSKVKVYTLPWTDQRNGVTHVPYYELEIEDICVANKIVNHLGGDHIWYQLKYPATQSGKTYQFVYSGDVVFTEESITFNTFSTPEVGSNSATIKIYIQNPNPLTLKKAGFILAATDLTDVKITSESDLAGYRHIIENFPANFKEKQTNIFYSIGDGKDLNYKLTPGTKYYVRFYIIDSTDKVHTQDGQSSFTTTGTHTHTWGSWTKADATNHKRTCSVCGAVETAAHSWNSGTVTKAATCAATGVKTFTCTVCNATKTETIAKLTSHTWGSWTKVDDTNHKRTCSKCSATETVAHTWGSEELVNFNMVKTCSVCSLKEYRTFIDRETSADVYLQYYPFEACNGIATPKTGVENKIFTLPASFPDENKVQQGHTNGSVTGQKRVIAQGKNPWNNLWYQLEDGFVYSGEVNYIGFEMNAPDAWYTWTAFSGKILNPDRLDIKYIGLFYHDKWDLDDVTVESVDRLLLDWYGITGYREVNTNSAEIALNMNSEDPIDFPMKSGTTYNVRYFVVTSSGEVFLSPQIDTFSTRVRAATGIELQAEKTTLSVGEKLEVKAIVTPDDTTNKAVTWASSNNSVASVDENGLVTAVSAGETIISATTKDGSGKTASITITVGENIVASGEFGENLIWKLDDNGVLTVSGNGPIPDCYYTGIFAPWSNERDKIYHLVIDDGITSIGEYAFREFHKLASVSLGNNVTSIGRGAFYQCDSLKEVFIPQNVVSIHIDAFGGATALLEITVSEANTQYSSDDGVLFDKAMKTLLLFPKGRSGTYEIPQGVTSIGASAFSDCYKLSRIIISDTVEKIGEHAFHWCSGLGQILFPNSVKEIDNDAFYFCMGLKNIELSDGLERIGSRAFYNCNNLESVTIPDGVTNIGEHAFEFCSSMITLTIGSGIEQISNWTFADCRALKKVTIPSNVKSIGDYAFYNDKSIQEVTISDSVTAIGTYAFYNCIQLTDVEIPSKITSIRSASFASCSSLKNVTIPMGVTSIEGQAFQGCSKLSDLIIPESVTSIGGSAFEGCSSLNGLIIPLGVTTLSERLFRNCTSLVNLVIPERISILKSRAFENCTSLEEIYFDGDAPSISSDVFLAVTATAYYHANKAGWNEAIKSSYGGNLTWQAIGSSIASIEIAQLPDKLTYLPTEELDTSGLQVKLVYEDDSFETVSEGFTVEGFVPGGEAVQTVTVKYEDFTTEFEVYVGEAKFKSAALVLSGQIGVNYYMTLDGIAKAEDSYIEFSVAGKNGGTTTIPFSDGELDANGRYVFTCYVSSIQMADEITAVYHFGDREVEQKYSIKRYVEKTLDSATAKPQSKVLAQAIANYGHYAQVYLSGYRGWTMGVDHAEMAAYGQPDTGADLSSFTTTVTNRHSYITKLSRQLGLDADTTLYILLDVDGAAHPDELRITVRDEYGNPVGANATRLADGRYQVAIPNISAHKLGMKYSIVVDDTMVIETSVLSYAAATLSSASSGASAKQAMAALYEYYAATMAFRG